MVARTRWAGWPGRAENCPRMNAEPFPTYALRSPRPAISPEGITFCATTVDPDARTTTKPSLQPKTPPVLIDPLPCSDGQFATSDTTSPCWFFTTTPVGDPPAGFGVECAKNGSDPTVRANE